MNARALAASLAAAATLLLGAAFASAGDAVGPPFGAGKVAASITDVDGEPDTDDYLAPMLRGETLSVSVAASGKSKLRPTLEVLDPDGNARTPALRTSKRGDAVSFRGLAIDATGTWVVRVGGADGTQGAYTASFQPKAAPRFGTKKGVLGGTSPRTAVHTFEATQGALVTLTLRPLTKKATVQLTAVTTPGAAPYAAMVAAAAVKSGVTKLKKYAVQRGTGTYSVTVTAPDDEGMTNAPVAYRLDISVAPQPRPKGTQKFPRPEPRLTAPGAPQRVAAGFPAVLAGHDLSATPPVRVIVGGADAEVSAVSADGTSVTIVVPDLPAPSLQDVVVVNADGQASSREGLVQMVAPPVITDVRDPSAAPVRKAPLTGGDPLRIVGDHFDAMTTVSFGAVAVPVLQVLDEHTLSVTSPVASRSVGTVSVADEFGRTSESTFTFQFPLPAWGEGDAARLPAPGAADDFSAGRAVAIDADRDGRADDVVLASPIRSYAVGGGRHGTRETSTRVLLEKADRTFADATATSVPAAFSSAFPYDTDDLNAQALAVGDLDGAKGDDLVLAGFAETYFDGFATDTLYGSNRFVPGVRALRNGGSGAFSLAAADQGKPKRLRPEMQAKDGDGALRPLFGAFATDRGDPAALAIGDLDKDGHPDLVVTRAEGGFRTVRQDVSHVDFTQDPPTIPTADADAYVPSGYAAYAYVAGTEILENRLATGGGFTYATERRMPLSFGGFAVSYQGPDAPDYHGDDVALADLDHDGDLDMVVAWHDPVTVSVRGLKDVLDQEFAGVAAPLSLDGPRVATRVLLNDGAGHFTDATDAWMPAGAGPEFWQAHRIALGDLDGDGWADLALVVRDGLDAWTTAALTDIAATPTPATATPGDLGAGETDTFAFQVPQASDVAIEVSLGTLADSVLSLYGPDSEATFVATDDDGGYGAGSRIVRRLTAGTWYVRVTGFAGTDAGTYTLTVRGRLAAPPAPSHAQSALRVLHNDPVQHRFVDATSALPALPDGDDFRGGALRAADFDGDGRTDLLVATTEELKDASQARIRSLRLLRGAPGGAWTLGQDLLPPADEDSGQADDLVVLPSPDGYTARSILLVSRTKPAASQGGRYTRLFDWNR